MPTTNQVTGSQAKCFTILGIQSAVTYGIICLITKLMQSKLNDIWAKHSMLTFGTGLLSYMVFANTTLSLIAYYPSLRKSALNYIIFAILAVATATILAVFNYTFINEVLLAFASIGTTCLIIIFVLLYKRCNDQEGLTNQVICVLAFFSLLSGLLWAIAFGLDSHWLSFAITSIFSSVTSTLFMVFVKLIIDKNDFDVETEKAVTLALLANLQVVRVINFVYAMIKGSPKEPSRNATTPTDDSQLPLTITIQIEPGDNVSTPSFPIAQRPAFPELRRRCSLPAKPTSL